MLQRDLNLVEDWPLDPASVDQASLATVTGAAAIETIPPKIGERRPGTSSTDTSCPPTISTGRRNVPVQVRAFYFPNRTDNPVTEPNATNIDPQRARVMAEAMLRHKAREFFTIEGTTIGLLRLRPGNYVQIMGMRPPFDGFFYVTKTWLPSTTGYGGDGMRTRFSARRPRSASGEEI